MPDLKLIKNDCFPELELSQISYPDLCREVRRLTSIRDEMDRLSDRMKKHYEIQKACGASPEELIESNESQLRVNKEAIEVNQKIMELIQHALTRPECK